MDSNPLTTGTPPTEPKRPFPWAVAIVAAAVVLLAALGVYAYLNTIRSGREVAQEAGQVVRAAVGELPAIAAKFRQGTITTTFLEAIPDSATTGGDVLELATAEITETFTREDSRTTLWGWLDLGTTVSEIRVPVTFRYHLKLSDPWKLTTRENVCVVLAPAIRPSNPPAVHTDRTEKRTENGWGRSNKDENLAVLEKSLTPELEARAGDRRHLRHVREDCRKSVAEFVRRWLLREDHWRKDRFTAVVVVFPDELKGKPDPESVLEDRVKRPTLTLP